MFVDGTVGKNRLPRGSILLYETDQKRFGKLKVVNYGYDMTVKWVTYDKDGVPFSKGNRLLIRGTYVYDLDRGVEADTSKGDIWWEQVDRKVRRLVAQNGASLMVYDTTKDNGASEKPPGL